MQRSLSDAARALGVRYPERGIVLTASGTTALTLALDASSTTRARVVALPAYACPDVAAAAIGAGFRIMLYDTNSHTLAPELTSVQSALDRGASHVVVAHLCGRVSDVAPIRAIAERSGAVVIEDAAQHAGGSYDGIRAGQLADWSILSFGRGKGLNAGGGGALVYATTSVDVPAITNYSSRLGQAISLGKAAVTDFLSTPTRFWIPAALPFLGIGETEFREPVAVTGMSPAAATLLCAALTRESTAIAQRQDVERFYEENLTDVAAVTCIARDHRAVSGALRFPIRIDSPRASALTNLGVVRFYPRTLHDYAQIQRHVIGPLPEMPGADALSQTLYTLPTHELVTMSERQEIVARLRAR